MRIIYMALLTAITTSLLVSAEGIDKGKLYYGEPESYQKPGYIILQEVLKASPSYQRIIEENISSDRAEYWVLVNRANQDAQEAFKRVERECGYDLIGEKGFIEGEVPNIVELVQVAVGNNPSPQLPLQVMIEVKIVEMVYESARELGVDWTYSRTRTEHEISAADGTGPVLAKDAPYIQFDSLDFTTGTFDVKLQALIDEGKAELLSNPRIVTIDKSPAEMQTGDKIPYLTAKLIGNTLSYDCTYTLVGVKLKVTPYIQEGGEYVMLDVRPEVNNFVRREPIPIKDNVTAYFPVFATRWEHTNVLVKDGKTLVIGGLFKNDIKKTERRIPILGSIPVLGFFFRKTHDVISKTELLIFITPHILEPGEGFIFPQLLRPEERITPRITPKEEEEPKGESL